MAKKERFRELGNLGLGTVFLITAVRGRQAGYRRLWLTPCYPAQGAALPWSTVLRAAQREGSASGAVPSRDQCGHHKSSEKDQFWTVLQGPGGGAVCPVWRKQQLCSAPRLIVRISSFLRGQSGYWRASLEEGTQVLASALVLAPACRRHQACRASEAAKSSQNCTEGFSPNQAQEHVMKWVLLGEQPCFRWTKWPPDTCRWSHFLPYSPECTFWLQKGKSPAVLWCAWGRVPGQFPPASPFLPPIFPGQCQPVLSEDKFYRVMSSEPSGEARLGSSLCPSATQPFSLSVLLWSSEDFGIFYLVALLRSVAYATSTHKTLRMWPSM